MVLLHIINLTGLFLKNSWPITPNTGTTDDFFEFQKNFSSKTKIAENIPSTGPRSKWL